VCVCVCVCVCVYDKLRLWLRGTTQLVCTHDDGEASDFYSY